MPLIPRIFIGSSSEGKKYAYAIQENLQPEIECVVWDQGVFQLSSSTLEDLVKRVAEYDFGLFVLSPDDRSEIRGQAAATARDNVIFELGLFTGKLGRERTLIVRGKGADPLHIPSDLLGITTADFDARRADGNWQAALAPACSQIRRRVVEVGILPTRVLADPHGSAVHHVAAICFRQEQSFPELLLVNTTQSRRMFPKGRIKHGQTLTEAALHYAATEGGMWGKVIDVEPHIFRYFKSEEGVEQSIAAILVEQGPMTSTRGKFRDPQWFRPEEAVSELIRDREPHHGNDIREVVRWAIPHVRQFYRPRVQSAVIPFRRVGADVQVLLITSRTRSLWIFPKGHIESGHSSRESAAFEAYEEAGIRGIVLEKPVGNFKHTKTGIEYSIEVFAMEVTEELPHWPEERWRRREWATLEHATTMVQYEHLKQILVEFKEKFVTEPELF